VHHPKVFPGEHPRLEFGTTYQLFAPIVIQLYHEIKECKTTTLPMSKMENILDKMGVQCANCSGKIVHHSIHMSELISLTK
jgi:hypothetical protein